MDNSIFVVLLITGFCIPSTSQKNIFYFFPNAKTFDDAFQYCVSDYTNLAQILSQDDVTTMMATSTDGYRGKAWIGLYSYRPKLSEWTWLNGQRPTYYNWKEGQPDNLDGNEFCVSIANGEWSDETCSHLKYPVCNDGKGNHTMSWDESKAYCESLNSTLAYIPERDNQSTLQGSEGWIGLYQPEVWIWSEPGGVFSFHNWRTGQPNNSDVDSCVAANVTDGTWSDERCHKNLPFFCYEDVAIKTLKTMVKMTIKSSADLEDPAVSAELLKQLRTAFAEGLEAKLSWRKHPVKTQEKQQVEETCPPDESTRQEENHDIHDE